ncbi:MAG: S8 family serine peptidase [Oscillospiraceae bacterium]|nr:S8 family serine peptidase [Oscillospiraceae bacterium]
MIHLNRRMIRSIMSLTAAAAVFCAAILSCGGLQCAAVRGICAPAVQMQQINDAAPATVIVRVAGDALLAQPDAAGMGADYLPTSAAAAQSACCKAVQQRVQEQIRSFYPALTVGYSYSTLINGFSCELPADLIDRVAALPEVLSVTSADTVQLPQMDRAAALSGFPAFCAETGCTGEGQVIAVIDSELDTSHPMFGPLSDEITPALGYEDIASVIESGVLHIDADPDRAYLSSKLPFVMDYRDADRYGGVPDPKSYHGTHVCGVACGNAYETDDGTVLSGIAKDAQLLFFACGSGRSMNTDAALAALEDAVALHADVINMSWGTEYEYYGENPFTAAVAAADRAGIIVCNSAGNSDNGTGSGSRAVTPDMPDTGTISDKAEAGSPILFVASADNTGQAEAGAFLFAGQTVIYRPTMNSDGDISFLSAELPAGEYAYTDCGTGTEDDMRAGKPQGKLALIRRTASVTFADAAVNAKRFGAVGVIVIDRDYPDGLQYARSDAPLKLAVITHDEGQMLLDAEDQTVTFTGETMMIEYPTAVSSFTSWGVKHSLDLRPDIMGVGGRVRSAAYDGSDAVRSGTSVASPYVAGCAAVLREYLEQQGTALSGTELTSYLRSLLMNTAIPYEEDGLLVTPRRQGAGMVSPARALAAKVLMTAPDGTAKINLYDKLESSFSFDLTLTNISDEAVTFADAALRLTTDGTRYDSTRGCDVLSGQQALDCTTDFSGPVTVAAGASETVTVQVELSPWQYAALSRQFRNGFFAEGFLLLSGAENSADISIPLLGFCGDWAQVPIADPDKVMAATVFGESYAIDGMPMIERECLLCDIRSRVPDSVPWYERVNLAKYADADERSLLEYGRNEAWISPNHDGIADELYGMRLIPCRSARAELSLLDADGTCVYAEQNLRFRELIELNCDQFALPEGDYTLTAKAYIDYTGAAERPQIFQTKLHVDKTAPSADVSYALRNGRQILTVTVSDDRRLQGIVITGKGSGSLLTSGDVIHGQAGDSEPYWTYGGNQYGGYYPWYAGDAAAQAEKLPAVLRQLAGFAQNADEDINFKEYIFCGDTGDAPFTFEYDVTDLQDYSFTVLDYAYNYTEIGPTDDAAENLLRHAGWWLDARRGVCKIDDGSLRFRDFFDGSDMFYICMAKYNRLTLYDTSLHLQKYLLVKQISDIEYILTDMETGEALDLVMSVDAERYAQRAFYSVQQLKKAAAADSAARHGRPVQRTELIYMDSPDSVGLRVYFEPDEDGTQICDEYQNLSLLNGSGILFTHRLSSDGMIFGDDQYAPQQISLFAKMLTKIPAGLYYAKEYACAFLFYNDGASGMILYSSMMNNPLGIGSDTPFAYTIARDSSITFCINGRMLHGTLLSDGESGGIRINTDSSEHLKDSDAYGGIVLEPVTTDPAETASLRPTEELLALAETYAMAVTGKAPCAICFDGYCPDYHMSDTYGSDAFGYRCLISFDYGWDSFFLAIDPLTLTGRDDAENEIDLLKPPVLSEGAYTPEALARMAVQEYTDRMGVTPDEYFTWMRTDNSVELVLRTYDHSELDVYTIDAQTGEGTHGFGETINLPETGRLHPAERIAELLAGLLLAAGVLCIGRVRRRRNASASHVFDDFPKNSEKNRILHHNML